MKKKYYWIVGVVIVILSIISYLKYDELSLQFKSCDDLFELRAIESHNLDWFCSKNEDCIISKGCTNKDTDRRKYDLISNMIDSKCVMNRQVGIPIIGCRCLNNMCEPLHKFSCTDVLGKLYCKIDNQIPFELFNESYQNATKCGEMGISLVTGGCVLQNIFYDKEYVNEIESKIITDEGCWVTEVHRFVGFKKGNTEIITNGTCEYNKTYKIQII